MRDGGQCFERNSSDGGPDAEAGNGGVGGSSGGGVGGTGGVGGSGAGGTNGGDGDGDNVVPRVTLEFPRTSFAPHAAVHARGRVWDDDGDAIARVTIAGVDAEIDGDVWSAVVPLEIGENVLAPVAEDARSGLGDGPSATITRFGEKLTEPSALVYDGARERALLLDAREGDEGEAVRVVAAVSMNGEVSVIAGAERGDGPSLDHAVELAFDGENELAFVLLSEPIAVLRVDLATGDRTVLANAATPVQPSGGPVLQAPTGLVFDPVGDRLFVYERANDRVLAIDSASGVRSVISDGGGIVPSDGSVRLLVDNARDVLFCIAPATLSVTQIALSSGARASLAQQGDGRGYSVGSFYDGVVDGDRLLLSAMDSIVALDLDTQVRTRLAVLNADGGPSEMSAMNIDRDPVSEELVLLDAERAAISRLSLELDDEAHTLSGELYGVGPRVYAARMSIGEDAIYATDSVNDTLGQIDLRTGDRTILSSDSLGSGVAFDVPGSLLVDSANHRALVLDATRLLSVDLVTGDRTLVSQAGASGVGTGPGIADDAQLAPFIDTTNESVVISSGSRLLTIDLTSGDRFELSGPGRGMGYLPSYFYDVAYYESRYYAICDADEVLAIDPATGDRTVISGASIGSPGRPLYDARRLDLDTVGQALIVLDTADYSIRSISLASGARRDLLQTGAADDIAVVNGRVLYTANGDVLWKEIAAHRNTVAYEAPSRGVLPGYPALDSPRDRVCGLAEDELYLGCVDFATAELDVERAGGEPPVVPWSSFIDVERSEYYLTTIGFFNSGEASIVSYDLGDGARTVIASESRGEGPPLSMPTDGAIDVARDRLLVLDATLPALLVVERVTGDRQNLSGGPLGEGPEWDKPLALVYDAMEDRALVVDTPGVIAVNLQNGDRTLLSGDGAGEGPIPQGLFGIALDSANRRAIVRDRTLGLLEVDLATGDREVLFDGVSELGDLDDVFLTLLGRLSYDSARNTVLYSTMAAPSAAALVELDVVHRDWTVLVGRVP